MSRFGDKEKVIDPARLMTPNEMIPRQRLLEIGELAADTARDRVLAAFESTGLTAEKLAYDLLLLTEATHQKVQYNAKFDEWSYSEPMTDNTTRLKAVELAMKVMDVMPSQKLDINDKRQTRELAMTLMGKMEEMQMLGMDDRLLPPGSEVEEGDLMVEMIKRQEKDEIK